MDADERATKFDQKFDPLVAKAIELLRLCQFISSADPFAKMERFRSAMAKLAKADSMLSKECYWEYCRRHR